MTETPQTRWHRLLGKLLEELLTPVGIDVSTELPVMADPPEADILLLRREKSKWSAEQSERLPDGVRDSRAGHILIEFKYTESVNLSAFRQTVGYDFFYKRSKNLSDRQVQTFLISSKNTRKATLERFDYFPTDKDGVYRSGNPLLQSIPLLMLNDLSDQPHNAYFKCFASRKSQKRAAFKLLNRQHIDRFSMKLYWLIQGLWNKWFSKGGDSMQQEELTPERVMEMGKMLGDAYLALLSPEERLAGLKLEDRLAGLSIKEIREYLHKLENKKNSD
ncbi:hypothetical protein QUF75_19975 [Desulfococcaceae bacterium HSG7]|nr:hypothetical protein [Desulfococcaceae bacterium HSG7]